MIHHAHQLLILIYCVFDVYVTDRNSFGKVMSHNIMSREMKHIIIMLKYSIVNWVIDYNYIFTLPIHKNLNYSCKINEINLCSISQLYATSLLSFCIIELDTHNYTHTWTNKMKQKFLGSEN